MHGPAERLADGIAFWYVPHDYANKTGEVFGGMNNFKGLLVAMNIFQNIREWVSFFF